jgi:hypothetical protein
MSHSDFFTKNALLLYSISNFQMDLIFKNLLLLTHYAIYTRLTPFSPTPIFVVSNGEKITYLGPKLNKIEF